MRVPARLFEFHSNGPRGFHHGYYLTNTFHDATEVALSKIDCQEWPKFLQPFLKRGQLRKVGPAPKNLAQPALRSHYLGFFS